MGQQLPALMDMIPHTDEYIQETLSFQILHAKERVPPVRIPDLLVIRDDQIAFSSIAMFLST